MLHEYDVVALKKELPGIAVPVSSEGTIVMVHDAGAQAYEVEFFDQNNETIAVCTGRRRRLSRTRSLSVRVVGDDYLELKSVYRDTK